MDAQATVDQSDLVQKHGKEYNMDKLFMHWCFTHGWNPLDPQAVEEYGMWCAEIDAYNEWDVDGYGNLHRYTAKDILWAELEVSESEESEAEYMQMVG